MIAKSLGFFCLVEIIFETPPPPQDIFGTKMSQQEIIVDFSQMKLYEAHFCTDNFH